MNKALLSLIFAFCLSSIHAQRSSQTINECWRFLKGDIANAQDTSFDDSNWELLNLPHSWNAEDAAKVKNYYRGIGWYRKNMKITVLGNKRYYLFFEGALQEVTVFVNGREAGTHKGGYTAFRFDVTSLLRKGTKALNLIAVKVDNSFNPDIPPLSADFTFWGGIYRDVYLTEAGTVHFRMDNFGSNGVFLETPRVTNESANLNIRGEIRNDEAASHPLRIRAVISDADGKTVREISSKIKAAPGRDIPFELLSGTIASPHLWSPDDPYLYRVYTQILDDRTGAVLDAVSNTLGFRWFSADTRNGFMLNGKPLKLMGACRHQDYPGVGNAVSNELNRYDMEMIKKMGANYIRIAHYPQDPSVLEACDRLGIIAWEEIPIVNEITMSEGFFNTCKTNLTEMIRQNFNHPAIVIWAYSNEVMIVNKFAGDTARRRQYTSQLVSLHKQLEQICRTEDPGRFTALAFHGSTVYNDYIGNIPMIVGWNRYDGWYGSSLGDFGKFLDEQNKQYPNRPLIISEYGAGSDVRLHSLKPEVFDFSIEYQQLYHESYLRQILARPFVIGASLWNFIDFGVASREESMPHINNKGVAYYNRQPKDVYYFYQAALSKSPVLHIASRDWALRKGIPAAAGENVVKQPVKVFSNLPDVELLLNGKSLGKQTVDNFNTVFDVPFAEGDNILEARSGDQRDVMTVNFKVQPFNLRDTRENNLVIAVNAGANCFFTDPVTRMIYEPDQPYREGSWGYVGGDLYRPRNGRPGIQSDIAGTVMDPLFQTSREGLDAYRFDVPNGHYEVELSFCEYQNRAGRNSVYDLSQQAASAAGQRVFNVTINNDTVLPSLDLAGDYGPLTAVVKTFTVDVNDGKGITVGFSPLAGKTLISALKVRRL